MMGVVIRFVIQLFLFLIVGLSLPAQMAVGQVYDTNVEGMDAEQWAEKIVNEGEALFSADYEPLGEEYALYGLMIRILLGNPTPEEQLELAKQYKKGAEKSGERRHLLISQMYDELLGGSQTVDYFIENGDWFTKMLARWIEANYLERNYAKFADLTYFYEPLVETKLDDPAYPAAMVLLTDLKRTTVGYSADLPGYIRNYKENYYWMKRLYPDYDVTFVYEFDALTVHYNLFGDPSALKIINSINRRSISPVNSIIMANRESRIHIHMGEYEKASNLLEDFFNSKQFEDIKPHPICAKYCPIAYAYAALSASASGKKDIARKRLEDIKAPDAINDPEFLFYFRAAKALQEMDNPSETDIRNWVDVTRNGQSRREAMTFRQMVDPAKRFTPATEPEPYLPGLPWYLGLLALLGLSGWLYKGRRDQTRRLADLSGHYEKFSRRNGIFEQHLNRIHALNERSSEQAQTALLSLERHIEDVRTLESVDMVSRSIFSWSEELSNLIFSAKYMATGVFEQKDLVDLPDFVASAKTRWNRIAKLEKSTVTLSTDSAPQTIRTDTILLNSVLDLFVQDALQQDTSGIVEINFETGAAQDVLCVVIKSQGHAREDFSKLLDPIISTSSKRATASLNIDNQDKIYALKALIESGGRFEQSQPTKGRGNILELIFPIESISDDPKAANSNQVDQDNPKE